MVSSSNSVFTVAPDDCIFFNDLNITVQSANAIIVYNITVVNTTVINQTFVVNTTYIQNTTNISTIYVQNITNISIETCPQANATIWANSSRTLNNATITCLSNAFVVNQTTNVINNTYPQVCPATSQTLWANSSGTFNNATITCLGNAVIQQTIINTTSNNITNTTLANCNLNLTFSPTNQPQLFFNPAINATVFINPIDPTYCLENRIETYNSTSVIRSEKANDTFYFNVPTCVATASVCAAGDYNLNDGENRSWDNLSVSCAASVCAVASCPNLTLTNSTGKTPVLVSVASLSSKDETDAALVQDGDKLISLKTADLTNQLSSTQAAASTLQAQVANKTAELSGWENGQKSNSGIYTALAAGGIVFIAFWIWRKGGQPYFSGVGKQPNPDKMKAATDAFNEAIDK